MFGGKAWMYRWAMLAAAGMLCGALGASPALAEDAKLGTIDLSKIFEEYKRTQEADAYLEKQGQAKQEERDKILAEYRRLKDELELMSESKRETKKKEVDQKAQELQSFDRKAREVLRTERDNMVRDILGEIHEVIESYGKAKGYRIIFNSRMLLYSSGKSDLTSEIVTVLNDKYESGAQ